MRPCVSFKTVGCRLNQAETARMAASFTAAGYDTVPDGQGCDVAVIHGCAITARAEGDSVRAARRAGRSPRRPVVILTGCPAEALGEALRGARVADMIVGQTGKFDLPALLHRTYPDRFPPPPPDALPAAAPSFDTTRAIVKVQDGCDFGCAYCIVPRARGTPTSRPVADIAHELRQLAAGGFREVVLTGANLGCYAHGDARLADVIAVSEAVPGIERVRLSSIELTTAEEPVIGRMARSTKLCHFLHVPLQSGDDRILRAMGRRYTVAQYREIVNRAAAAVPDLGLGTDIIAGFPGEDEDAFQATLTLVEALPFSNLHVFPFSPRRGTRAAAMPGQVPETERKARVRRLLELGKSKREAFARRFQGRDNVEVLVERVESDGTARGWTGEYLEATVAGVRLRPNQIVRMRVETAQAGRLSGSAVAVR